MGGLNCLIEVYAIDARNINLSFSHKNTVARLIYDHVFSDT